MVCLGNKCMDTLHKGDNDDDDDDDYYYIIIIIVKPSINKSRKQVDYTVEHHT